MLALGIRTDRMPENFTDAILIMARELDMNRIIKMCNILWCIWKNRNEEVFQGKKCTPQAIISQAVA